jgi:hypothetical protein
LKFDRNLLHVTFRRCDESLGEKRVKVDGIVEEEEEEEEGGWGVRIRVSLSLPHAAAWPRPWHR